jgi:hypothetical protein
MPDPASLASIAGGLMKNWLPEVVVVFRHVWNTLVWLVKLSFLLVPIGSMGAVATFVVWLRTDGWMWLVPAGLTSALTLLVMVTLGHRRARRNRHARRQYAESRAQAAQRELESSQQPQLTAVAADGDPRISRVIATSAVPHLVDRLARQFLTR